MSDVNPTTRPEIRELPFVIGVAVGADGSLWTRRLSGRYPELGKEWRPLKQAIDNVGYLGISFRVDGKFRRFRVHTLVLEMFIGPRPEGHEALHGDGNKLNNAVGNLRWGTRSENMKDAVRHGTHVRPANSGRREMTPEQVRQIPELRRRGMTQKEIGKLLGVSQVNISRIELGKIWAHLK